MTNTKTHGVVLISNARADGAWLTLFEGVEPECTVWLKEYAQGTGQPIEFWMIVPLDNSTLRLWVDDVRLPPPGYTWVKTAEEALDVCRQRLVETASLDHDLGMREQPNGHFIENEYAKDGTWLMEQLILEDLLPRHVYIHSQNPVGALRMKGMLRRVLEKKREQEHRSEGE